MNHTKNNKRNRLTRRGISFLLAFVLMMSAFAPGAAYATDGQPEGTPEPCTICNQMDCGGIHCTCAVAPEEGQEHEVNCPLNPNYGISLTADDPVVCGTCEGAHKTEECTKCPTCKNEQADCTCPPVCGTCEGAHKTEECTKCPVCKNEQADCTCTPLVCEICQGEHETDDCTKCPTCLHEQADCICGLKTMYLLNGAKLYKNYEDAEEQPKVIDKWNVAIKVKGDPITDANGTLWQEFTYSNLLKNLFNEYKYVQLKDLTASQCACAVAPAADGTHEVGCDFYAAPSPYEQAMTDLTAFEEEAKHLADGLDKEAEDYIEKLTENCNVFYDKLVAAYTVVYELFYEDEIDSMAEADAQRDKILAYLKSVYGYENGTIETLEEIAVGMTDEYKESKKVDAQAEYATIHLFNYSSDIDLNNDAPLRFRAQVNSTNYYGRDAYVHHVDTDGNPYAGTDPNQYSNWNAEGTDKFNADGGNYVATPSKMSAVLVDGYPYVEVINNDQSSPVKGKTTTKGSLKYLFDPDVTAQGKTYYKINNADGTGTGLFQKDSDGYYYYNSAYNHAEYDTVNKKFQLYDFSLRPFGGSENFRAQGHLLPFNTDLSKAMQIIDEDKNFVRNDAALKAYMNRTDASVALDTSGFTEGDKAFWRKANLWTLDEAAATQKFLLMANEFDHDGADNGLVADDVWVLSNEYIGASSLLHLPDYWYGMTVEIKFNISAVNADGCPVIEVVGADGTKTQKDMIFSFLGDDDVFVYVDDVLLLDLGGGACDYGEINFTKMTSKETAKADISTAEEQNIEDLLKAALEKDGKVYDYETSFAKYTTHTLKFFYLERGTGTANCRLKFNMEPMPPGTVQVVKELEDSTVTSVTADDEYTFLLEERKGETWSAVEQESYVIDTAEGKIEGKTDDNGCFKLKQGEMATFTKLASLDDQGRCFRVSEVDDGENATIVKAEYTGNQSSGSVKEENESIYSEFTIMPDDRDNGIVHTSKFTNVLLTSNFTVTKNVTGNMGDWSKEFAFTAELYTKDGGTLITFPAPGEGDNYTVNGDGNAVFSLAHDQTLIFNDIPLGAYVVVKESDYATSDGYTTTVKVDNGDPVQEKQIAFITTLDTNDHKVVFINDKEATIDTGVVLDSLPYILILGGVAAVAVFLILRRRNRYDD